MRAHRSAGDAASRTRQPPGQGRPVRDRMRGRDPAMAENAICACKGDSEKHRAHRSGSIVRHTWRSARWTRWPPDGHTSV